MTRGKCWGLRTEENSSSKQHGGDRGLKPAKGTFFNRSRTFLCILGCVHFLFPTKFFCLQSVSQDHLNDTIFDFHSKAPQPDRSVLRWSTKVVSICFVHVLLPYFWFCFGFHFSCHVGSCFFSVVSRSACCLPSSILFLG